MSEIVLGALPPAFGLPRSICAKENAHWVAAGDESAAWQIACARWIWRGSGVFQTFARAQARGIADVLAPGCAMISGREEMA